MKAQLCSFLASIAFPQKDLECSKKNIIPPKAPKIIQLQSHLLLILYLTMLLPQNSMLHLEYVRM